MRVDSILNTKVSNFNSKTKIKPVILSEKSGNTSNNINAKVSANNFLSYNPQISFSGKKLASKAKQEKILEELSAVVSSDSGATKAHDLAENKPDELLEQLNRVSETKKIVILEMVDNEGDSVATTLAVIHPEMYLDATKQLSPYKQFKLLMFSDNKSKCPVAHDLAIANAKCYLDATNDFSTNARYDLLRLKDGTFGVTTARQLLYSGSGTFLEAIEDLSKPQIFDLISIPDKTGYTIAHTLASEKSNTYQNLTNSYYLDEKLQLLQLEDNYKSTVAHKLAQKNPEYLETLLNRYSDNIKFSILQKADYNYATVAHLMAESSPVSFIKTISDLSNDDKEYLLGMQSNNNMSVEDSLIEGIIDSKK